MENASRYRWMGRALPVLVTGLCIWLGYSVVATGMAGHYVMNNNASAALRWRPTSPEALAARADSFVRLGDYRAADATARRALRWSALRADAIRTLAISASAEGREDAALALMSRAGKINPRDLETQNWLFEKAMLRSDYNGAVEHADAMMRRSSEASPLLSYALAARLGDSRVRAALTRHLEVDPPWREKFLTIVARNGSDADVAALYQALRRTTSPVSDHEVEGFFIRLVSQAKYRQAKSYFDNLFGSTDQQKSLVYNGGFSGLPGPPPLNWQAMTEPGGSATWTSENGEPLGEMRLSHDGFSSSNALVRQLVLLPAGSYQVSTRTRVEDPSAAGRFKLQITCVTGPRLVSVTLNGAPGSWAPAGKGFDVPPEACAAQWLQILPVTGERREVADMSIDDIVIRPVAAGLSSSREPEWRQ